jgi:tankyrase
MLLQQGADPTLRNSEGKTALDVADPLTRPVLSEADYRKDELLEVARSGESGQTLLSAFHPLFHFFVTVPHGTVPGSSTL